MGWTRSSDRTEDTDTREVMRQATRVEDVSEFRYTPPSNMPDPHPRDGWVHRWVRISIEGQEDPRNAVMRSQEGWEPVKANDYPELVHAAVTKKDGSLEVGGLILCRAPAEMMAARDRYYRNLNNKAMEAVDASLGKVNDSRMPLYQQRSTKVSFGSGT